MSKILGEKVDIIDECMGVSQLLGVRVYAYGQAWHVTGTLKFLFTKAEANHYKCDPILQNES